MDTIDYIAKLGAKLTEKYTEGTDATWAENVKAAGNEVMAEQEEA